MSQELLSIMEETEIRRAFGRRLKELRKQKGWTQKELAQKLGVRFSQLNKYESGLHTPPVDKLVLLSEVFDTTIDYLLAGGRPEQPPLHNTRLVERLRALEDFRAEEQETVLTLIDAMILKHRVEGTLKMTEKQAV